jgi:pimeloyl-ACP methyl ester carboxylesterase
MPTIDNSGLELNYLEAGRDDRPALVFLHGLSDSAESWAEVAQQLGNDHRVLCLDFRGHGRSSRATGTYRLPHYASDAAALIERVAGGSAVLVGHSLGGLVAAHLAQTRPELVRGAYLEDPPLFLGTPERFGETTFATLFPIIQDQIRAMQSQQLSVDAAAALIAKSFADAGAPPMTEQALRAIATAWLRFDASAFDYAIDLSLFDGFDPVRSIACATHVIRADPELGPAFFERDEKPMRAGSAGVTFTVVRGASHSIHHEQPVTFARDLSVFLDRSAAPPPQGVGRSPRGEY